LGERCAYGNKIRAKKPILVEETRGIALIRMQNFATGNAACVNATLNEKDKFRVASDTK
jgi:hypothetical protein